MLTSPKTLSVSEHAKALDVRAAIFHMAAILDESDGAKVTVPSMHMTGSGDGPERRKQIFDGAPEPKVYRNQQGEGHTEPVLLEPAINPALGPYARHCCAAPVLLFFGFGEYSCTPCPFVAEPGPVPGPMCSVQRRRTQSTARTVC